MTLVSRIVRPSVDPRNTRRYSLSYSFSTSSFTPYKVQGLALDLDGDKDIILAPGVSSWGDQQPSPTVYTFLQSSSNQQPSYTENNSNLGYHSSVNFSGTGFVVADNMVSEPTSDPLLPEFGFYLVLVGTFTQPSSGYKYLATKWSGSTGNRYWLLRILSSGSIEGLIGDSGGQWQSYITTVAVPSDGNTSIHLGYDASQNMGIIRIGSLEETWSVPTVYTTGTPQPMTLGRVSTDAAKMDLVRVLGYTNGISLSDRSSISSYLSSRYGVN